MDALARQLNLRLTNYCLYSASMDNSMNSVLVFGPPRPGVLVNGQRIGDGHGIGVMDDHLVVPTDIVPEIRSQLRVASNYRPWTTPGQPPRSDKTEVLPPVPTGTTVMLDPGHGGKDPGTLNRYGDDEKTINLDVAIRVRNILQQRGVRVLMTRQDDRFVDLDDRPAMANRAKADLMVAIHTNSAPKNTAATGVTVYVARQASAASLRAAKTVLAAMDGCGCAFRDRGSFA